MLSRSLVTRLSNFSQIKIDPWFNDFSWENLLALNIQPPYIPTLAGKENKNNPVAFINYIKLIKEYLPSKPLKIDKSTQEQYDRWFKEF
jgi:hypothetical protein